MKKKSILVVVATIIIVIILNIVVFNLTKPKNSTIKIPDGYICVFHGGSEEVIYETYVYKLNNREKNQIYNYVNVTKTKLNKNNKYEIKITKNGVAELASEVFMAANENSAYSYVTQPNSNKKYTIAEYMDIFIMN